jgi:hypothetical protein
VGRRFPHRFNLMRILFSLVFTLYTIIRHPIFYISVNVYIFISLYFLFILLYVIIYIFRNKLITFKKYFKIILNKNKWENEISDAIPLIDDTPSGIPFLKRSAEMA